MYNLLIVDDEPIIVNSLYNLFNDSGEFELNVYKAYSGSEALEQMKKTRIDIVLTDICMPNIDGIMLLKQINKHWPRCRVIFLTGYDNFDYAQEAIRNKSIDYVLKVEGDEMIYKAVEKAVKQIRKEESNTAFILRAKEQIKQMRPFMQKRFFLEFLQGYPYSVQELSNRFKELEIPLKADWPVFILLSRVDNWKENNYSSKRLELIYNVQAIMEEYLKQMVSLFSIVTDNLEILWLIQPCLKMQEDKENEWKKVISYVHGTLSSVQKSCKELLGISISYIVSNGFCKWDKLGEKFETLKIVLNREFGFGQEMILSEPQIESPFGETLHGEYMNSVMEIQQQIRKVAMIAMYLESGQNEEFQKTFLSIMEYLIDKKRIKYGLAAEIYYSIALAFQSCLNKMAIAGDIARKMDLRKLMNMDKHASWHEVSEYFQQLSSYIFEYRKNRNSENTNRIVKQVQRYILDHLHEDLSLSTLADVVFLNPAYLSRLYKQSTGQGLSDYIIGLKLKKAQEMLADGALQIHEIAMKLGFTSHAYFSRFFKKHMKMNPQEYRDSLEETASKETALL